MRGRLLALSLGLLLVALCTTVSAQTIFQNPSFENGMAPWVPYGYIGGEQAVATNPVVGTVGAGGTFSVLFPDQGPAEGTYVCGIQGWYDARCGGVYQTFTAPSAGYVAVAERAFSVYFTNPPLNTILAAGDKGARVRIGLATGATTSRNTVPYTGPQAWKKGPWGPNWNSIVMAVPGPGVYTLFIENNVGWDDSIYNTLWDNVRWATSFVDITAQPYVSNITETTATIRWTTDVAGTSVVYYDNDGPPYNSWASGASGTNHEVTLTGLTPGTSYQYSVITDAPPALEAVSPNAFFTTAPTAVTEFANGDFEAKDTSNNPTFAPWVKFGKFNGIIHDGEQATPVYGGGYAAGAIEGSSNEQNLSGCLQRIKVKPGANYVVKAYVWTETNLAYPPMSGNQGPGYNTQVRVGINPKGGVDLWYVDPATGQPVYDPVNMIFQDNPGIAWSAWDNTQDWQAPFTQFGYKEIGTIVQVPQDSDTATVFLQVMHQYAYALNRTVFDDVIFVEEVPVNSLGAAKKAPVNWVVDLNNGGQGYIVTRTESMPGEAGIIPYCWIQEDDRSGAMKVNLANVDNGFDVLKGQRITIKGRTKKFSLNGVFWGENEIAAEEVNIVSSDNSAPNPVAMANKAIGGGDMNTMRGANNGFGTNNVGLLIKTTGRVTAVDPNYMGYGFAYTITIDDGSGVNVRVYHPEDYLNPKEMPTVGQMVSATGTCGLKIIDPTPGEYDVPNGSGDEIVVPTVMLRDGLDLEVIPE